MHILFVHNYYREQGGEDVSFHNEMDLLARHGHQVDKYTRDNHEILEESIGAKLQLFRDTSWSQKTVVDIREKIRESRPQIIHVQNFFPLISPSIFSVCRVERIPVVFSVRNYRLMCPNGLFFRDGHPCEDCMGKSFPYPAVLHACYRNSRLQTLAVASMLRKHNSRKTWNTEIDQFIALSKFAAGKLERKGLEQDRIMVKPNFLPDPGLADRREDYAVCIGRLSAEKGVPILLNAWQRLRGIPLKIIGTGPCESQVVREHQNNPAIEFLGYLPYAEMLSVLRKARLLVCPTELYETFCRVVVESYACGVPVAASRTGAVAELVKEGETGLLFNPGDPDDLAAKVVQLWGDSTRMERMGMAARDDYLAKYTPEKNYKQLMEIYQQVLERNQ